MLTAANVWHSGEAAVLTYGDSMLFLKCVTERGGSERTKHAHLAFVLLTLQVNQELNARVDIRRWASLMCKSLKPTIPDLKDIQSETQAPNDHIISLTRDLFANWAHS